MRYLFSKAVLRLWSERPALQTMIKKGVRAALPREKNPIRIREVDAFLDGFNRIPPRDLSIGQAAAQVMLDHGDA